MSFRYRLFGLMLAGASIAGLPALAQPSGPVTHVRGTVESLSGDVLTVKSRDGDDVKVRLAPNWTVLDVVASSFSAIKPGDFIGTAAIGPDTGLVAREVVIFPASMKGAGEGHYPWDLGPQSTMTNATVSADVAQKSGRELTLTYKGGQTKVLVPPDAPVVTFEPGEKSTVKPGAKVFIGGPMKDGMVTAARVAVGKDGLTPPM